MTKPTAYNNGNNAKIARRGQFEIIAEILMHCAEEKGQTNIMFKTNLNYMQLMNNLKSLTSRGLLTHKVNKYITTKKGYRFLELFAQLNAILQDNEP